MRLVGMCALVIALAMSASLPARLGAQAAAPAANSVYTCSMHKTVVSGKPGSCPVCSMTLKARAMTPAEQSIADFLKAYDAAFAAKDLKKLGDMYTEDATVFEGGGVNFGWEDYRDKHLGPELKAYSDLRFSHSAIAPHLAGTDAAYVTADYTLHAKTGARVTDSTGLATYDLVKQGGVWKIAHAHTSAGRK